VLTDGFTTLADGVVNFMAQQTLGPTTTLSKMSQALPVTIDSIAPEAPAAPAVFQTDDTGVSNSDAVTNVRSPRLVVQGKPYSRVYLDGALVSGASTVNSGIFPYQGPPLADGTHTIPATIHLAPTMAHAAA